MGCPSLGRPDWAQPFPDGARAALLSPSWASQAHGTPDGVAPLNPGTADGGCPNAREQGGGQLREKEQGGQVTGSGGVRRGGGAEAVGREG